MDGSWRSDESGMPADRLDGMVRVGWMMLLSLVVEKVGGGEDDSGMASGEVRAEEAVEKTTSCECECGCGCGCACCCDGMTSVAVLLLWWWWSDGWSM